MITRMHTSVSVSLVTCQTVTEVTKRSGTVKFMCCGLEIQELSLSIPSLLKNFLSKRRAEATAYLCEHLRARTVHFFTFE